MGKLSRSRIFIMNSFSLKVFAGFTLLILLIIISINVFFHQPLKNFYITELKNNLMRVNLSLEPEIHRLLRDGNSAGLDRWVKKEGKYIDTRITVINPDGEVAADSHMDPAIMDNHGDRPEIRSAIAEDKGYSLRFSRTVGEQMLYVASPVTERGDIRAVVRTSIYLRDISAFMKSLRKSLMRISVIFFVVALAVSWYLSIKFNKPVRSIIHATEKFAAGDFNSKLFFESSNEFGKLAKSFNKMVDQQELVISKLTQREEELSTIISSMEEGLIVINRDGNIIHWNESFRDLCGVDNVQDSLYWEVIRIPKIEEMISGSFEKNKPVFREIKYNGRYYLATFSKIYETDRMVITFKDISEIKELELMKKDFVMNLTHELKTPLTAIMGFIETLEDEEDIKNLEYINIIKRHSERMNMIVSDLMVISELEDEKSRFDFRPTDITAVLNNIIKMFSEKISDKGIKLNVDIEKKIPEIRGEEFKLEQMFINLLDNAHKYTENGEINIRMSHLKDKKKIRFVINNTGSYIPEDALPRIFERFFVVDRSRSRTLGGTGLGLSIVKHVAQLHSAEITADANPEDGTTFTVDFPVQ